MNKRTISWWSAGVASSVTAAILLKEHPGNNIIAYCDTSASEHPDNLRFLKDCEKWYGQPILRLRSTKYRDSWDVFEKTRWLVGPQGARCTTELKKLVRRAFQRPDDVQAFGFTVDEHKRAELFKAHNPEVNCVFPLIDHKLSHADCKAMLKEVGIETPTMYKLGYKNNNCIGCVKGGAGYWNKIRKDFPEQFNRMALLERDIGVSIYRRSVNGKKVQVFLDELDPSIGRYSEEPEVECGLACGTTLEIIANGGAQ